jgi:Cu(I)/Ag(I) efflux system membrane fusion protein
MTSKEKKVLLGGVAAGLILAGVFIGLFLWQQETASAAKPDVRIVSVASDRKTTTPAEVGTEPGTTVQLDAEEINAAGVQLAKVSTARLNTTTDAVGRVEQPEAQLATIPARVGGRIDKLYVQFTGEPVRRSQPVAEIYSPELLASAEEYRLAIDNRERLERSSEKSAVNGANQLVAASRRRLELWGMSDRQIEEAGSGKAALDVTIYAPVGGTVVERKVTNGQYVNAGDALFTVADLNTVWVKADVYEFQIPQIHPGQTVQITSEALPDKVLHGRVDFVEPEANPQTRTIPVHIHVPNPGMRLRPGMYVRAKFVSPRDRETLVIPRSAVLDTGTRKLVYVAKPDGVFEAREIQTGNPVEDLYPVLAGLNTGEQVVTNGNFLIDSQTRLTGGMTGLFGGSKEYSNRENTAEDSSKSTASTESAKPSTAKLTLSVDPSPAKGGSDNIFHVSLADAGGKAITDAQVTVTLVMPAMPSMGMPEMLNSFAVPFTDGMYMGKGNVPMAGSWNVLVEARRGGQLIATYRTRLSAE